MTYGEIIIDSLKLMFVNASEEISEEYLSEYSADENYRSYILNMRGAINRCFSVLENKKVLPLRSLSLREADGVSSGAFIRFDLKSLAEDFFDVERIVYETQSGEYNAECSYMREGDTLVLPAFKESDGVCYTLIYNPSIKRIAPSAQTSFQISDVPDSIAVFIPYYIKGELYRDDEPNEAGEARNWFEQSVVEIQRKTQSKTNEVKNIYSQTE